MTVSAARKIDALIFDVHPTGRQQARTALLDLGFENVLPTATFTEFRREALRPRWSLIVANAFPSDSMVEVSALVRRLRTGEFGVNPFACVVLTSWRHEAAALRSAVDSGADHVLLCPYSPARFLERVHAMLDRERQFVVGSDYIGPDRRRRSRSKRPSLGFEVPSMTALALRGEHGPHAACPKQLSDLHARMLKEQTRQLAIRICAASELAVNGSVPMASAVKDICRLTSDYLQRLRSADAGESAIRSALTLARVARSLEEEASPSPQALMRASVFSAESYADYDGGVSMSEILELAARCAERMSERRGQRTPDAPHAAAGPNSEGHGGGETETIAI